MASSREYFFNVSRMARIEEEVLFTVCRFEIDIRFNSGLFIHDLNI